MRRDDDKRRRGRMSAADKELWERVKRTLEPLPDKRARPQAPEAGGTAIEPSKEETALQRVDAQKANAKKDVHLPNRFRPAEKPAVPPPPPPMPNLSGIDRQTRRRIARGTIEIDARIDLHGMTQHEAHMRLKGFLRASQASGHRHVLVITGKGRPGPVAFGEREERGVLKRALPHWLSHPEFRDLVAGLEEAHIAHGGGGAYYIRLRRRKGDTR